MLTKLLLLVLPLALSNARQVSKRGVVLTGIRLWPKDGNGNVVIPYNIDGIRDMDKKKKVEGVMDTFHQKTCVRFEERRKRGEEVLQLQITPDSSDGLCHATTALSSDYNWGTSNFVPKAELNIGKVCTSRATILHEMMHVLGIQHEHSRNDRNRHIVVDKNNIRGRSGQIEWRTSDETIHRSDSTRKLYGKERTDGYPYDIHSVMHYRQGAFALQGKAVFQALKNGIVDDELSRTIGFSKELSLEDVDFVNHIYDCKSNKAGQPITVQGPNGQFGPDPSDSNWNGDASGAGGSEVSTGNGQGTGDVNKVQSCNQGRECQPLCRARRAVGLDIPNAYTDCYKNVCVCSDAHRDSIVPN